ncbi:Gag-Pol polyprotein [Plakobranchus ocellatus]|uniref:Gag-Pol polyprotein n=1 Tax=Plakobranchus ocellatus TaxID=259542 RepID=A0AAV4AHS6_9GAST|nr:Gag-Pol polyprotein [Plakobranchus ocellatus]
MLRQQMAEAVPVTSKDMADALFTISSSFGIPVTVLSDNAHNLVSNAMQEITTLMKINRRLSTPYLRISNDIVERLGGKLKRLLTKLTDANVNWDVCIPAYCSSSMTKFPIAIPDTLRLSSCLVKT